MLSKDPIKDNLVTNLVRIFIAYGWCDDKEPDNFRKKLNTIAYGLTHGRALDYLVHLESLMAARRKDHNWGLYTSTFVEGIHTLLTAYGKKHQLFEIPCVNRNYTSCETIPKDNVFLHTKHGIEAFDRLRSFGKTNIRYSLIEEYGEDRIRRDLRETGVYATLSIQYEDHEPDQLRDWLYDDGKTRMTVMYPILPLVYITLCN